MDLAYYKMPFGKYEGIELDEIWEDNPGYLEWCVENLTNESVREKIEEFVDERKDRDRRWGRKP